MKKIALLSSLAFLALGLASQAQAQCYDTHTVVLRCVWDWHGNYEIKNCIDTNNGYFCGGYYSCAEKLDYILDQYELEPYLKASSGNALTDTYVIRYTYCE